MDKVVDLKMEELNKKMEELNFAKVDVSNFEHAEKGMTTYAGKIDKHTLSLHCFKDRFLFTIHDDVGIVKLLSFKKETPVSVLVEYIKKVYEFFSL